MKQFYILMIMLVPFACFAKVKVLAPEPVAWYPFNGNANDAQGSLHGTVFEATLTTDRFGNANSAYYFDGIDDVIETADVATTNNVTWALTAWIKLSTLNQLGAVVTNGYDNVLDYGTGYSIHVNNGNGTVTGNVMTGASDGVAWYNSAAY
ncbi:hypothetical protein [Dyadobacter arcticus]|uniref:Uncharacterized protein n=1 Tax=Dyadobacter arcticus TaxID=1078754 RepID=A0ABX0UIT4_9BACT|nr:hypothetical protein [Dyadobacter arcticus]NIJ52906.1 hypothetical protein [Dyadobacter arcticus]